MSAAAQNSGSRKPEASATNALRGSMGRSRGPARPTGEKPRDFKGTMRKLLRFARPYFPRMLLVLCFAILSTVFAVLGPLYMGNATTELFNGAVAKLQGTGSIQFSELYRLLVITLALYLASAGSNLVQGYVMAGVTQHMTYDLREAISKKINRLPMSYFETQPVGDILSRITNDVDTVGSNLSSSVTQIISTIVTILGIIVMMLIINPLMTLLVVLLAPLGALGAAGIVKMSQKHFIAQQRSLGEVNTIIEETFSGHTEVRSFNHEDASMEEFRARNDKLFNAAWKSQFLSSFMKPVMDIVGNAGYVAVAVVGAILAAQGVITVGNIQSFIQYERNFMQPVTSLAQISNVLQQIAAAAERVFELLDAPEELPVANPVPFPSREDVVFDHVSFGYDPDHPVIRDFSAKVKAGQTVALVGPTGAGKTTMVKLLMRFYDVQSGSISIGGVDVRQMSRDDIRDHFGMVLQDAWLFSGSIGDNIRYGKLDATDDEVIAAAKAAKTHRFIMTLPGGYEYLIGEDGGNISQGQRQLLTIARAILANRSMLILDEATSSVDTRTEARIQRAMDNLMHGRTCFVIAHRLSTIKNADMILVLDHGDIVEQGTHQELLDRGGAYAALYNAQFRESTPDE